MPMCLPSRMLRKVLPAKKASGFQTGRISVVKTR